MFVFKCPSVSPAKERVVRMLGSGVVVPPAKVLATKPDGLSFIPEIHTVCVATDSYELPLISTNVSCCAHAYVNTHSCTCVLTHVDEYNFFELKIVSRRQSFWTQAQVEGMLAGDWPGAVCTLGTLLAWKLLAGREDVWFSQAKDVGKYREMLFLPAKSSSSRFTDRQPYDKDSQSCFGLLETHLGDICSACVLPVERRKNLPAGSNKKLPEQDPG